MPRTPTIIPAGALALLIAVATSCFQVRGAPPPGARDADCTVRQPGPGSGPTPAAPVRWVTADDREDAAALAAWCAAVGPPVVRAGAAPAAGVDSLAVITWNTNVGAGDLVGLVADLRAGRLTGGEPVEHFVLLLQEVYRAGRMVPAAERGRAPRRIAPPAAGGERLDVVEAAGRLGLDMFYAPSMRNGRDLGPAAEDRGNAILSTLPLEGHTAIELPYEAQRRVAVAAGVGGTTSRGAAWRVEVASLHLDVRSRVARLPRSVGAARLRQARAAVDALADSGAVVLGGDINTWAPAPLEGALTFLRQAFPDTPSGDGRATFHIAPGIGRRLDHLFFRLPEHHAARSVRLDSRYGSDHHPLLGWVRFAAAD